ncbi:MAG: precorrin-2 dehydrogenase/sirohydrochlorin ferrochelatase family protein, partial [Nitriliruptorales bacterium]
MSLDVEARRCVVVGGGDLAAEKAAALADAGAAVVSVPAEGYRSEVLDGAFLAISTGEDATDPATFFADAEARGVLVNVMDDIPHCHFAFPAIVRRGDLKVAISTAGRAPALARRLRIRFDEELPEALGELVDAMGEAREAALPRTVSFSEWAARWRGVVDDLDALVGLVEDGRAAEVRDRVLAAVAGDAS